MRGMRPDDVLRLTGVADPRVSPDGTTIAYVVTSIDAEAAEPRSAIWTVPVDASSVPRRVTQGPTRDASPRWSPDGRWLAFTSARDGETSQLFVLPADGPGEARRLTDMPEDVEEPAWSPDSRSLVVSVRDHDPDDDQEDPRRRAPRRITRLQYRLDHEGWTARRTHSLWIVPLDDEPTRLTNGEFEDTAPAWSPDGERIVFSSARRDDWDLSTASDLYVLEVSGGEPRCLTQTDGTCDAPSWSPDGGSIAYLFRPGLFDEPRHGRVAVIDVETGERRVLTQDLDRTAAPFPRLREPLLDGNTLTFAIEDRGRVHLYRVPADGSAPPEPVVEVDGWITGYDVHDGTIVHAMTTTTSFSELYVGERRLTDVGSSFFADVDAGAPEAFTAVAPDGTEVDAWVIRPAGLEEGRRYPAVLNVHGGPFTQYGLRFFDEFQVEAGAGFVVLFSNPRGSSGSTEAWGRAIRGPARDAGPGWGSVDFDDLMAVVDAAVARFDFIDPDRLAVMGGSYGGYMTSWIVSHTDRFACAISERAVNEFASEDGESDLAGFFAATVGAHPWEDPDAYRAVSPLSYAERITTPLLILHSEDDLRCPIGQGEMLFTMLRRLRREVEFVRFPAESHELTRSGSPTHRIQRFEIVLEWLRRHLG